MPGVHTGHEVGRRRPNPRTFGDLPGWPDTASVELGAKTRGNPPFLPSLENSAHTLAHTRGRKTGVRCGCVARLVRIGSVPVWTALAALVQNERLSFCTTLGAPVRAMWRVVRGNGSLPFHRTLAALARSTWQVVRQKRSLRFRRTLPALPQLATGRRLPHRNARTAPLPPWPLSHTAQAVLRPSLTRQTP
jgi:hypothetical protein